MLLSGESTVYSSFKKVIEWNNEERGEMRMEMSREGAMVGRVRDNCRVGVERVVNRAFSQEGTKVMAEETDIESTRAKQIMDCEPESCEPAFQILLLVIET